MDYLDHIETFPEDLRKALEGECYLDAMRLLLARPDDAIKWETLGDLCHKMDLAEHARAYWQRADSAQVTEKLHHHQNDQTWVFAGPELVGIDQIPEEGHYTLLRMSLPGYTDRYEIRKSEMHFFAGASFGHYPRPSSYLEYWLKEENTMVRYFKSDLKAEKPAALAEIKRVMKIKEEIVRKIPKLAYCLQSPIMHFSLPWKEKPFAQRDENYLKETLKVLSRKWYPSFHSEWTLPFQPLIFKLIEEKETTVYQAKLTRMVPWKQQDEHAYRMYGVDEWVRGEWEEGIWVEVREEEAKTPEITLHCKRSDAGEKVPTSRKLVELEVKIVDEKTMEFSMGSGKNIEIINHLQKTFG